MKALLFILLLPLQLFCQLFSKDEISRCEKRANNVTIIRDKWGVPHIYGNTDADAVFGLMYAQCEDDFRRVDMNYTEKLGLMSSTMKGESELYNDLLIRIVIDANEAKKDYENAPAWLKKLCDAFADGVNYYLYKHPETTPATQKLYQPWYPFLWTDGSIGAINTAGMTTNDLRELYGKGSTSISLNKESKADDEEIVTGSNGFAFSPKITESGNAILYINPHVTFYFRPEVHMVSNEGLNAYGAVTWGQFFVYQGFNEHCGWMHTSSAVDAADSYIEKLIQKNGKWFYKYDGKDLPIKEKRIVIPVRTAIDLQEMKAFNILFTHHGPIMGKRNGEWLSVRADNRISNGLIQCWQRTKATSFEAFKKTLDLKGNISNNTVYADAEGNIAYWHGNRIPKRDLQYDWSKPVDGSVSATEWKGYHDINETVLSINPSNGWLQNCNSTPYTCAGENSPKKNDYPAYMAPDGENFRGLNAVRVLSEGSKYDIESVIKAGYDKRLTAFEILVPALVNAFEKNVKYDDSLYALLIGPISVLKNWDYRCGENSIATTLAVEWGQRILTMVLRTRVPGNENADQVDKAKYFVTKAKPNELITPLLITLNELDSKYGRWQTAWGLINRFQRISSDIDNKFDDNKASIPVGFVSSAWGMLPSYTSRNYAGTVNRYGVNGNSFICAVEFGKKIKAKSLLAGGESGHEYSKHFFDQGEMYAKGQFKDVLFYKEDVMKHAERTYHPGE